MSEEQATAKLDARPLYIQVRDIFLARVAAGVWRPGTQIPNEFELAEELGVSQGTVRKALDSLTQDAIFSRRPGRGTVVAERTPTEWLFRFFNLYTDNGARVTPEIGSARATVGRATANERQKLGLVQGDSVIRIHRLRSRDGRRFIRELIVVPQALFPGLEQREIPNTLYDVYQRNYGVIVSRADERLTAVAAEPADAEALSIAPGSPLLKIDRVTFSLNDRPIELRSSVCHLEGAHYLARLR
jgi:GntR family transcriptional regulator